LGFLAKSLKIHTVDLDEWDSLTLIIDDLFRKRKINPKDFKELIWIDSSESHDGLRFKLREKIQSLKKGDGVQELGEVYRAIKKRDEKALNKNYSKDVEEFKLVIKTNMSQITNYMLHEIYHSINLIHENHKNNGIKEALLKEIGDSWQEIRFDSINFGKLSLFWKDEKLHVCIPTYKNIKDRQYEYLLNMIESSEYSKGSFVKGPFQDEWSEILSQNTTLNEDKSLLPLHKLSNLGKELSKLSVKEQHFIQDDLKYMFTENEEKKDVQPISMPVLDQKTDIIDIQKSEILKQDPNTTKNNDNEEISKIEELAAGSTTKQPSLTSSSQPPQTEDENIDLDDVDSFLDGL